MNLSVKELQSGRPTITGIPTFQNGIKFGDASVQESAKGGTASSSWTFVSGSTLTINIPAASSAAFSLNNVYQKSLVSGFAVISGTSSLVLNSLNVSSVTFTGTGTMRINWAVPMATNYYVCNVTCGHGGFGGTNACYGAVEDVDNQATTVLDIATRNTTTDAALTAGRVYVVCYGGAEASGLR